MFAVAAVVAFALALILHWTHGVAPGVVATCVLFGWLFIAVHLAWPLGFGWVRRPPQP